MPAMDMKAYLKRNKNDAADPTAMCEAMRRPTMRFVRIKPAEQQGQLMHYGRTLPSCIVAAQGGKGIAELLAVVADERDARLPIDARARVIVLDARLEALQAMIGSPDKRIKMQHCTNDASMRFETIPGYRNHRGDRNCSNRNGCDGVSIGARFRGVDRTGAATELGGWQAEARADLQTG